MAQQQALFLQSEQGQYVVGTRPVPKPGQGEVLIKVESAALNPIDWKVQAGIEADAVQSYPVVLGESIAGIVSEVGPGVTNIAVGDRVATPSVFANSDYSGFQQYALGKAAFTSKIPSNVSLDEAASLPVALDTPAIGLFGPLNAKLTSPIESPGAYKGQSIVILGGSSSVGLFTIQLARLAGYSTIIATASPHHEAYLKSLGATHVVDRRSSASRIVQDIKDIQRGEPVKLVYDAISEADTQSIGMDLLTPGGHMVLTLPVAAGVSEETGPNARTAQFTFGSPHVPEHAEIGQAYWAKVYEWLQDGSIVPNKVEVVRGGLQGVVAGLERLKAGTVSRLKLVVRPHETT